MSATQKSILGEESFGIASVANAEELGNFEYRLDKDFGIFVFAEARAIDHGDAEEAEERELLAELSKTMVEVLHGHLSNYLGSKNQQQKIKSRHPEFINFILQSILGTDPIVIDSALHNQAMSPKSRGDFSKGAPRNIAVAYEQADGSREFPAVQLHGGLPNVSVNLEVAVFFEGGVHIAHRGSSQQYLMSSQIEKVTEDYRTGGLLSALDGTADFLPKIEHKSIKLKKGDRLVVLSQGVFPEGYPNLKLLFGGNKQSPKMSAKNIVRNLSRHHPEAGYVFVIDPNFKQKKLGLFGGSRAAVSSKSKTIANFGGALTSRKSQKRERSTEKSARPSSQEDAASAVGEGGKIALNNAGEAPAGASPGGDASQVALSEEELTLIRSKMFEKIEFEMLGFEKELSNVLEKKLMEMEERIYRRLSDRSGGTAGNNFAEGDVSLSREQSLEQHQEVSKQDGAAIDGDKTYELSDENDYQVIEGSGQVPKPPPPMIEGRVSEEFEERTLVLGQDKIEKNYLVYQLKKLAYGIKDAVFWLKARGGGITGIGQAFINSWFFRAFSRLVDKISPEGLRRIPLNKRAYVALAFTLAIIIGLSLGLIVGGDSDEQKGPDAVEDPGTAPAGTKVASKNTAPGSLEQPREEGANKAEKSQEALTALKENKGENDKAATTPPAGDPETAPNSLDIVDVYYLGEVATIEENYNLGRRLYREGDRGHKIDGARITKENRIERLRYALNYFYKALRLHGVEGTEDPDLWFIKARTEYVLAKLGFERADFAARAIESYRKYGKIAKRPPKRKRKAMRRNLKRLAKWK